MCQQKPFIECAETEGMVKNMLSLEPKDVVAEIFLWMMAIVRCAIDLFFKKKAFYMESQT